jgi:hypothetical protein
MGGLRAHPKSQGRTSFFKKISKKIMLSLAALKKKKVRPVRET